MESYMHDFFTAAKRFLTELKDLILLLILVIALAISGYQFLAWKLIH
jgi:hypothetical protein